MTPAVEVTAPATGVRLQFVRSLEIRGRIEGLRLERFTVTFRATDGSGVRAHGWTGGDGGFVLGVEEAATGVLYARGEEEDERYALLEGVTPGAGSYTLTLEKGLRIAGRVRGSEEGDFLYVHGPHGISKLVPLPADGTFEVRGLPPGLYDLRTDSRHPMERARVAAGSTNVILER
jgi:hypothetical protein